MKGFLFTQRDFNAIADNGEARREIGVIASSRTQAEKLVADQGFKGTELVASGDDLVDRFRDLGMNVAEVKIL